MKFDYNHPHTVVDVNDMSAITVSNDTGSSDGPTLLACGVAEKGEDGKLIRLSGPGSYVRQFGEIDVVKQGQSNLNVNNWLAAGGSVEFMRLCADDATYANVVVYAEIQQTQVQKVNDEGAPLFLTPEGEETVTDTATPANITQAGIKITTETVASATDTSALQNLLNTSNFTDDGTYTKYPLYALHVRGRGNYGNNVAHRVVPSRNDNANCEIWTLDVITTSPSGKAETASREFALDPKGVLNNQPTALRYVLEEYPTDVKALVSNSGISAVLNLLQSVANEEGVEVKNLNFLTQEADTPQCINVESSALDAPYGVSLENGSDGAWDGGLDFAGEPTYETKFASFYNGTLEPTILDINAVKFDHVLDANYPSAVKSALVGLGNARNDITVWLDGGVVTTVTEGLATKDSLGAVTRSHRLGIQHKEIVDGWTSMFTTVTWTYFLASKIPSHVNGIGFGEPMAAEYGAMNGATDMVPKVATDVDKDKLYDAGIIYVCNENGRGVIQHQQTLQSHASELSKGSNCEILNRIIKTCYEIGPDSRFKVTDSDGIDRIIEDTNDALLEYQKDVEELSFEVVQDDRQRQLNILERKVRIVFQPRSERSLFSIGIYQGGE